ncbi:expressed protein [Echinococcus multilocularis]|uniref:Expressed protein n=1 Tax=Echinococcus multilocularis TaxID=6211 RepID=A0A0S4MLX9_ECHMU|nr:expressed protein [Echinococcus multilocularis]
MGLLGAKRQDRIKVVPSRRHRFWRRRRKSNSDVPCQCLIIW